jgi:hypothetical protein
MAYFAKEKTDWLRKFSPFKFGTPSHETLRYFLCAINPAHLVQGFVECVLKSDFDFKDDVISIDGKTIRGSGSQDSKTQSTSLMPGQMSTELRLQHLSHEERKMK